MYKLITIIAIFLSVGIATDNVLPKHNAEIKINKFTKNNLEPINNGTLTLNDELYDISIHIENKANETYNLVIEMVLKNDSYFVSPNSKRAFKGKFTMDFGTYDKLDFKDNIMEIPRSVEEVDLHPFVNGTVNWIRVNTIYTQPLNLKSEKDFEMFGRVMFTIEPRCSMEIIPFGISYKSGKMTIIPAGC